MNSTNAEAAAAVPESSGAVRTTDPKGTAGYIAELTTELAGLARASGLEILAYLLEIAQLEASTTAKRLGGAAVER